MANKAVTNRQTDMICKMANDKGVSRGLFQEELLDGGLMGRVLDAVKTGQLVTCGAQLAPPQNARLRTFEVECDCARKWQDAIRIAAPNGTDGRVERVGSQYPENDGIMKGEVVLLNWPDGGFWDDALAWAKQSGVERCPPRFVFALVEQRSAHSLVQIHSMMILATQTCRSRYRQFGRMQKACYLCLSNISRNAGLVTAEGWEREDRWFAFLRKRQ